MKLFSSKEEANKILPKYKVKEKFLFKASLNQDSYEINMNEENINLNNDDNELSFRNIDIDNVPWIISKYVFENNREQGYKLHIGDLFKLGKYILKVKELSVEEDKKIIIDRKNTQKISKTKNISINNISQIPLNSKQQEDDYARVLNLNNNNLRSNNDNNININENEINQNINNEEEKESSQENNIHIIENENEERKSNSNFNNNVSDSSKISSSNNNDENNNVKENNINNSNNNNNINNNLNFASVVNVNRENFNNLTDQSFNNNIISIYHKNKNQIHENNSPLKQKIKTNININNVNENNKNMYFINIIKNNSDSNSSKNKKNSNSFKVNSFGFNTFKKDSLKNSSINKSNFQSLKLNETNDEIEKQEKQEKNENINRNSKKYLIIDTISKSPIYKKNSSKELKSTASFHKNKALDIIQNKILKESEKHSKPLCRICLSEEHIKENPLIHPCNCDGTMKYIHLQCLRLLIQSKIKKTETDFCKVLTFKKLECEICKTSFPEKISIKGSLYSIIEIDKPDKDYIILEGLIKENPEEKSIFIIHFKDKKEIKIGRATDANIRLNDISVSRAHAVIKQFNDYFYLHDTNSKFGTLIKMKNNFNILLNKPFFIQKGNTFYEFIMKKTFWAYFKCYKQRNNFYMNYNEYFDDILFSKYNHKKEDDILINEKTKSVSEYSSEVVVKYSKIDIKSIKSFNRYESKEKIENNKKDNYIQEKKPKISLDSFKFNNKSKIQNSVINITQENSNIIHFYKNDMNKSKSKDELNIEE